MGGSKEGLRNALILGSLSDRLLRLEDKRLDDHHVRTAAQAIITRLLRLARVLLMRDIAIRIRQEIAGEDFHGSEEYEKHRRAAKRLGPKAHLLYLATTDRQGFLHAHLRNRLGSAEQLSPSHATTTANNPSRRIGLSGEWHPVVP